MSSHGTRDWVDIANAARELLDALPTVWQGSDEGQRLRTLLDTVDASRTATISKEQIAAVVVKHFARVGVFAGLAEDIATEIADAMHGASDG